MAKFVTLFVGRFVQAYLYCIKYFGNGLTTHLKHKGLGVYAIDKFAVKHAGNVQNLKPVQNCTGFVFCIFHVIVSLFVQRNASIVLG